MTEKTVMQTVTEAEEKLGADLQEAARLLTGAFRAADLLNIDMLGHLHEAEKRVAFAQSALAERRADD
jgi:hypothetical protein